MTDNAKRTPWYPWGIWPVRVGWYEMRGPCLDAGTQMFWNGQQFGYWIPHPNCTMCSQMWVHWADDERDEWRGLKRPA
jgi:hypothetical protein